MCLTCAEAIGEAWATFASCVRNCDDPATLDETGQAMALSIEDTAIGTTRVAEAVAELTALSGRVHARFDSLAIHMYGVACEAEGMNSPMIMGRW